MSNRRVWSVVVDNHIIKGTRVFSYARIYRIADQHKVNEEDYIDSSEKC